MVNIERFKLSKNGLFVLLDEIQRGHSEICSLYVPASLDRIEIEALLDSVTDKEKIPEEVKENIENSKTGSVLFWGRDDKYLIIPPFPVKEEITSNIFEADPLRGLMQSDYLIGLILVRMGEFLAAVYQGEEMKICKNGTGLVHSRHRQGGSSAHRFERHRDKQIEAFFTRVCSHTREYLEPYQREIDFLIYGGAKETVREFRRQCDFTGQLNDRTLPYLLNIREPRKSHLPDIIREVWSSRVIRCVESLT
jgi:peptide subunit release factor 1 (eRF1)